MNVEYRMDQSIGSIILSNPPVNCFTVPDFTDEVELSSFLNQPSLKAIIIRGAGRHFSAGADQEKLKELAEDSALLADRISIGKHLLELIRFAPVPVLALINGSCFGAGLELALACHFRFASKGALFGFPESGLGLLPGLGGTVSAGKIIARSRVVELIVSGRMIGADEALEIKLVDKVESFGALGDAAVQYLQQLTSGRSPHLIHSILTAVNNGLRMPREKALHLETEIFCSLVRDKADE